VDDRAAPLAHLGLLAALLALTACATRATPQGTHPTATAPPAARAPAAPPLRYLALGDSFTIGTGGPREASFPARLAARVRAAGREVILRNLGVNGFTTQNLLDLELPAARGFAPSLVTLAIGANDLVRGADEVRYRAQVQRIFAALASAGIRGDQVVTLPQPDWSRSPAAADFGGAAEIAAAIARFNAVLAEESARVGARYVDLWPLMLRQADARMLADDGLHPDGSAYDAWAAALFDARIVPPAPADGYSASSSHWSAARQPGDVADGT
jgi:lysophospholipase L1-like esterase